MLEIEDHGGTFKGIVSNELFKDFVSSKTTTFTTVGDTRSIAYNSHLQRIIVYVSNGSYLFFHIYDYELNLIASIPINASLIYSQISQIGITKMILDKDGFLYLSGYTSSSGGYTGCIKILNTDYPFVVWVNYNYGIQDQNQLKLTDEYVLTGTTGITKLNRLNGELVSTSSIPFINSCTPTNDGNYIYGLRANGTPSFNLASGTDFTTIKQWVLGAGYHPLGVCVGEDYFCGIYTYNNAYYARFYDLNTYEVLGTCPVPSGSTSVEYLGEDIFVIGANSAYSIINNKSNDKSLLNGLPLKINSTSLTIGNTNPIVIPISKNKLFIYAIRDTTIKILTTK